MNNFYGTRGTKHMMACCDRKIINTEVVTVTPQNHTTPLLIIFLQQYVCMFLIKWLVSVLLCVFSLSLCFPQQSFFIMSVFAVALLLPAGWILHHLPEYRQRRPAPPPWMEHHPHIALHANTNPTYLSRIVHYSPPWETTSRKHTFCDSSPEEAWTGEEEQATSLLHGV